TRQVVHDFAAARGMTDMHRLFEIEMCSQRRQVVGVVIHVVAASSLRGPAMPASVVRDDAIAMSEEEQHLRVPIICRQRPSMAEHDGLTRSPIFVENLNAVSGRDGGQGIAS